MPTNESWEEESDVQGDGRPPDVGLAVKLLAGIVAFNLFKILELWSRLGTEWVAGNRVAWIRPGVLVLWAVLIVLMWKGNSWARNLVLVAIAWDLLGLLTAAGLLAAIGRDGLLGILSWINLLVEVFTAYLLLQDESLDWYRRQ